MGARNVPCPLKAQQAGALTQNGYGLKASLRTRKLLFYTWKPVVNNLPVITVNRYGKFSGAKTSSLFFRAVKILPSLIERWGETISATSFALIIALLRWNALGSFHDS